MARLVLKAEQTERPIISRVQHSREPRIFGALNSLWGQIPPRAGQFKDVDPRKGWTFLEAKTAKGLTNTRTQTPWKAELL